MKVVVYGSGCRSCEQLYDTIKKLVREHNIDAEVEYVSDLQIIIQKRIMQMPGLEIDGVMRSMGRVPREKELLLLMRR